MKLNFTLSFFAMAAFVLSAAFTNAQTTHSVVTDGTTFSPAMITIDTGDTVEWTNTGGSHNVNGTTADNPLNPESFGNDVGEGWTYSHTFTIAGNYTYFCDPHLQLGMAGLVTVVDPTSVEEVEVTVNVNVFPQPADDVATFDVEMGALTDLNLVIFDLKGRIVKQIAVQTSAQVKVEVADWNAGTYVYQLKNQENVVSTGTMMVR